MNHAYEIELSPTRRQVRQLHQQAQLLAELRQATREHCAQGSTHPIAALLGESSGKAEDRAGAEALLVHAHPRFSRLPVPLLAHTIDLERRALEREVLLTGTCPSAEELPRQPALVGPELVRPRAQGYVGILGVEGPVQAATDQLPPWARLVLSRETPGEQPDLGPLLYVPALSGASRHNWADIRLETHGWVLELEFVWETYPAGTLMRMWEDGPDDRVGLRRTPEVARLMGWDH